MNHSGRVYLLASPANTQEEISVSQQTVTLLERDRGTHNEISIEKIKSKHINIFKNSIVERKRVLEQSQEQHQFDIVGWKEIKFLKDKLEKKKKLMISGARPSTINLTSFSVPSYRANSCEFYLTKDQLMYKHRSKQYSHRKIFPNKQNGTDTADPNNEKQANKVKCGHYHEFSISKLKKKMMEYQKGWQKHLKRRKRIKYCNENGKQTTSLLMSSDEFRSKVEIKQQNESQQDKLKTLRWQMLLRKIDTESEKQRQHIRRGGLRSLGRNKWRQECMWVEQKDKQGYFFKIK